MCPPKPHGAPGFIRIDSLHQGDFDGGLKGAYHINAVDCVTQFELVASWERISQACLMPVLHALLHDFPFTILGFHADNGSEYIATVARLLDKLRVEDFTKSRPGHSNDNALAETKNAAIVRKHPGLLRSNVQPGLAQPVHLVLYELLFGRPLPLANRRSFATAESGDRAVVLWTLPWKWAFSGRSSGAMPCR